MTTAIVDYGSGNLHSAEKAFKRMADPLGQEIVVTADPEIVRRADRIMLPGVGAFGDCAAGLAAIDGMKEALVERVIHAAAPFFGVCVGMQLMAEVGRERGDHRGLGWIAGEVGPLAPEDPSLKIPHIGWNSLGGVMAHPVLDGVANGDHVYFVHSFAMRPVDASHTLAFAEYGRPFAALVGRDNMIGSQFHPEKSQRVGLQLVSNFLRWRP